MQAIEKSGLLDVVFRSASDFTNPGQKKKIEVFSGQTRGLPFNAEEVVSLESIAE